MPYKFYIKTPNDLIKAFEKSTKSSVLGYIENDITFGDAQPILKLDENCKGITLESTVSATLRNVSFCFKKVSKPIIFQNLQIRVGANGLQKNDTRDAIYSQKCKHLEFLNCSFSDSSDEVLSFDEVEYVKLYRCIIGNPLHAPTVNNKGKQFIHPDSKKDGSHGYGIRLGATKNVNITECLFANNNCRSPQLSIENTTKSEYNNTIENNVMFNYGEHAFTFHVEPSQEIKGCVYNITLKNNTLIPGPRTKKVKDSGKQKVTIDFESQKPKLIKINYSGLETNNILFYEKFYVEESGKSYFIDNGEGIKTSLITFLTNVGCLKKDTQDTQLIKIILSQSTHVYDKYDDKIEKWDESYWKSW
jgi:hypothetical protein